LLKAEQYKIEEEARAERTAAAAKKVAIATALSGNRTLEGFDMETTLSVNLLENQIKVNKNIS
jgi:hypothetical protein